MIPQKAHGGRRNGRSSRVSVSLPNECFDQLAEIAIAQDTSLGALIAEIVVSRLEWFNDRLGVIGQAQQRLEKQGPKAVGREGE